MTVENKDKMKDLFSSKLQSFEPEVPGSLWARIDQSLSQRPAAAGASSAAHSVWLKVAAAITIAVTVATVVIIAVSLLSDDSDEKKLKEKPKQEETVPKETEPVPADIFVLAKEDKPTIKQYSPKKHSKIQNVELSEHLYIKLDNDTVEITEHPTDTIQQIGEENLVEVLKKKKKTWSLRVFGNYGLSSKTIEEQGKMLSFKENEVLSEDLEYGKSNFKLEHDHPISFGVILNKELTNRLSVETGLIYTYLSSSIVTNENFKLREKQKFHYIGIPLSINYTFIKYKELDTYISAGGMIQKDFHGTYRGTLDEYIYPNESREDYMLERLKDSKRSISQKNPQFSTHFNLGISYPVYRKIYIYGAFGGVYYFDASNRYRTIYSDKDLQWNLNLGLKWKF